VKRYLTFVVAPECDDPEHLLNAPGHVCHPDAFAGDYATVQDADDCVGSDMCQLFDQQTDRWYEPNAWPTA
jgi:hypothetical protein